MKENKIDYCTDMMIRRIANREPVVAYMAHPYGGNKENIEKACNMAERLANLHPPHVHHQPLGQFPVFGIFRGKGHSGARKAGS